mmetsp:Transcript_38674/g.88772  ORF Transcript_38674/g.88772 Transcript_38674/m.88772 type:complete len:239 (+) Transcript_38674:785-1501(+)
MHRARSTQHGNHPDRRADDNSRHHGEREEKEVRHLWQPLLVELLSVAAGGKEVHCRVDAPSHHVQRAHCCRAEGDQLRGMARDSRAHQVDAVADNVDVSRRGVHPSHPLGHRGHREERGGPPHRAAARDGVRDYGAIDVLDEEWVRAGGIRPLQVVQRQLDVVRRDRDSQCLRHKLNAFLEHKVDHHKDAQPPARRLKVPCEHARAHVAELAPFGHFHLRVDELRDPRLKIVLFLLLG